MKLENCDTPLQEKAWGLLYRRLTKRTLFLVALGFALYAGVIAPAYVQLSSNVLYQDSVWAILLYAAQRIIDLLVFFGVYGVTLYCVYRQGVRRTGVLCGLYGGLVLAKYIANFVVGSIADGAFPSWSDFCQEDLPIIGGELLSEWLQYGVVLLTVGLIFRRFRRIFDVKQKAVRVMGRTTSLRDEVFPFKRPVDRKNPLQRAALLVAFEMTLARWLMHLLYQFVLLVYNGEGDGWLQVTLDLVGDAVIGVVAYCVFLLLMQRWDRCELRLGKALLQQEQEGSPRASQGGELHHE